MTRASGRAGLLLSALLLAAPGARASTDADFAQKAGEAVEWMGKSVEYAAACLATYRQAEAAVAAAAGEQKGPWTVVLDIDETVWGNVNKRPLPGAVSFVLSVRASGGQIVYITDRPERAEPSTRAMLKAAGLLEDGDLLLGRRDAADTKEVRRVEVAEGTGRAAAYGTRAIVAQLGDNIRDFYELHGAANAETAIRDVSSDPRWGKSFFMLPNPLYGPWQHDYE